MEKTTDLIAFYANRAATAIRWHGTPITLPIRSDHLAELVRLAAIGRDAESPADYDPHEPLKCRPLSTYPVQFHLKPQEDKTE
jgi:hypothetical protein